MVAGMAPLSLPAAEIDFEGLPEGYILDEVYTGHGVTGSLSGVVKITGSPRAAIVYASDCPPGGTPADCSGGDDDLGTPNECVGGPGVDKDIGDGTGGECGSPYQNLAALGNVAVVAQNLIDTNPPDGNVDNPNDADAAGQYIEFDFTDLKGKGVTVNSVTYLDNDEGEDNAMILFYGPGTLDPSSFGLDALGDNGVLTLTPGIAGVDRMRVVLDGSGAVTTVVVEEEIERPCWVTLGGFNKDTGTVSDAAGQKYCTFGGNVGPPPSGSFEVNWHNTGDPILDGSKFHTNAIVVDHCEDVTDGPGQPGAKKGLVDDTLFFNCDEGKFNGESGYTCLGFFQDNKEPQGKKWNTNDKICLEVRDSSGGFVASCGMGCDPADPIDGGTVLVGGNVQIHPCLGSQCEPK